MGSRQLPPLPWASSVKPQVCRAPQPARACVSKQKAKQTSCLLGQCNFWSKFGRLQIELH